MLVDEAHITVIGGKGGNGRASFFPGKGKKTGPDGGRGGNGGSIYAVLEPQMFSLTKYAADKKFKAGIGGPGGSFLKTGANGEDVTLKFPPGTTLVDKANGYAVDLTAQNSPLLLVRGGIGGRGNTDFKASTNTTPRNFELGRNGEEKHYMLVLKLIADYGLIGLPNAGKSSLLNELTSANVRTAPYPFTTLEPNLGALANGKIIADIPGLIEGASSGKGLGHQFLKHVEKVSLLLHCVPGDSADPLKDYETVRHEMGSYNEKMLEKPEIILLTKTDLLDEKTKKAKLKQLAALGRQVLPVSIHDYDALQAVNTVLAQSVPVSP